MSSITTGFSTTGDPSTTGAATTSAATTSAATTSAATTGAATTGASITGDLNASENKIDTAGQNALNQAQQAHAKKDSNPTPEHDPSVSSEVTFIGSVIAGVTATAVTVASAVKETLFGFVDSANTRYASATEGLNGAYASASKMVGDAYTSVTDPVINAAKELVADEGTVLGGAYKATSAAYSHSVEFVTPHLPLLGKVAGGVGSMLAVNSAINIAQGKGNVQKEVMKLAVGAAVTTAVIAASEANKEALALASALSGLAVAVFRASRVQEVKIFAVRRTVKPVVPKLTRRLQTARVVSGLAPSKLVPRAPAAA